MARPEITGSKSRLNAGTGPIPHGARAPPAAFLHLHEAFTIAEFCIAHRISRATYYVLKKRGEQPEETHILDRIIITQESASAWRRQRTAASRRRRSSVTGNSVQRSPPVGKRRRCAAGG
jgi:hypothetical protein